MLTSLIDNLISDYNLSGKRAGVFRFEGIEGLQRTYNEILKEGHDVDMIMDRPRFRKFLGEYNNHFVKTRKIKGMKSRVITSDYEKIKSSDKSESRQVKYLPKDKFPFEIDLKITKTRIVVTTLKEEHAVGITIIDSEIARSFKILFELIWGLAQ